MVIVPRRQENPEDGFALGGLPRNHGQPAAFSRLQHGFVGVQLEVALLLFQAVATDAFRLHEGSDHGIINSKFPRSLFGRSGQRDGGRFDERFDILQDIAMRHRAAEMPRNHKGRSGGEERNAVEGG